MNCVFFKPWALFHVFSINLVLQNVFSLAIIFIMLGRSNWIFVNMFMPLTSSRDGSITDKSHGNWNICRYYINKLMK